MPKKTMKKDSKKTSSALKFLASLFFLYVLMWSLRSGIWGTYIIGTSWAPLLIAVAVLGSIALFFGGISGIVNEKHGVGGKWVYITAFALIALTVSSIPSEMFWLTIVGFIVGWLGVLYEWER